MLKIDKNRILASKKSLFLSFHSLYGLSGHLVLCVLARSAPILVLHLKWRKQRKEQSHAQCHVTHQITVFDQISQHVKVSKYAHFAVREGPITHTYFSHSFTLVRVFCARKLLLSSQLTRRI